MRTITTLTTRQLATSIANQKARNETSAAIPHLVSATETEVGEVRVELDAIVDAINRHPSSANRQLDRSALTSTEALRVQDTYLDQDEPATV